MSRRAVLFCATALLLVWFGPTRLHVSRTLSTGRSSGRAGYPEWASTARGSPAVWGCAPAAAFAGAVHGGVAVVGRGRVAGGGRAVWGEPRIRGVPCILRNIPLPTAPPDAPAG